MFWIEIPPVKYQVRYTPELSTVILPCTIAKAVDGILMVDPRTTEKPWDNVNRNQSTLHEIWNSLPLPDP